MHTPLQPIIRRSTPTSNSIIHNIHNMQLLLPLITLHLYPTPHIICNTPCQVRIPTNVHYGRFDQTTYFVRVRGCNGVGGLEHFAESFEGGPASDDFPEFGGEFEGGSFAEEGDFAHFGCFAEDKAKVDMLKVVVDEKIME